MITKQSRLVNCAVALALGFTGLTARAETTTAPTTRSATAPAGSAEGEDGYACKIVEYVSKQSAERKQIATFTVPRDDAQDPAEMKPVVTGTGADRVEWKISRIKGRVLVNVKPASGSTMIFQAQDLSPVGLEILESRNILSCKSNAENTSATTAIEIDPRAYGELMEMRKWSKSYLLNRRAFGLTEKDVLRLEVLMQRISEDWAPSTQPTSKARLTKQQLWDLISAERERDHYDPKNK